MALSQNQLELHDRMVTVKERAEAGLLALDAVRGVGVGLRQENGQLTDELAIIVYARGADALTASLPATIEGYPVSVQEADFENQKTESAANMRRTYVRWKFGRSNVSVPGRRGAEYGAPQVWCNCFCHSFSTRGWAFFAEKRPEVVLDDRTADTVHRSGKGCCRS